MADDLEEDFDDVEGEDGFDEEGRKRGGSRKMLILILLPLLLIIGGAAGAYFTGMLDPLLGGSSSGSEAAHGGDDGHGGGGGDAHGGGGDGHGGDDGHGGEAGALGHTVFYDLPEMIVDLNTTGRQQHYLKVRVSLELAYQQDVARVEEVMPRVIDNFQTFLRELRVEDLQGAAGIYRVREELLRRVGNAVRPAQVNAVLFKEMLVQ